MAAPEILQLALAEPLLTLLLLSSLRVHRYQLHALVLIDIRAQLLHANHRSAKEPVLMTGLLLLILDQLLSEVFFDFFLKVLGLGLVLYLEKFVSRWGVPVPVIFNWHLSYD